MFHAKESHPQHLVIFVEDMKIKKQHCYYCYFVQTLIGFLASCEMYFQTVFTFKLTTQKAFKVRSNRCVWLT